MIRILIFIVALFPMVSFAQLSPAFTITQDDIGIPALYGDGHLFTSPDGNYIIKGSYHKRCISLLSYEVATQKWDHQQTIFLGDPELVSTHQDFPIVFSPDGNNVYFQMYSDDNSWICNYQLDKTNHTLIFVDSITEENIPEARYISNMAFDSSGTHLYCKTNNRIHHYKRNPEAGKLEYVNCNFFEESYAQYWMKLTSDNKNLYLLSDNYNFYNYAIDQETGSLELIQQIEYHTGDPFTGLSSSKCFNISEDNKYVYIASAWLSIFKRNDQNGLLEYVANQVDLGPPYDEGSYLRHTRTIVIDSVKNKVNLVTNSHGIISLNYNTNSDTLSLNQVLLCDDYTPDYNQEILASNTNVFVRNAHEHTLEVYTYNADTPSFTHIQKLEGHPFALHDLCNFAITADLSRMYMISEHTLCAFDRNPANGNINFLGATDVNRYVFSNWAEMVLTQEHIYVVSDTLRVYKQDTETGVPELIQKAGKTYEYSSIILSPDNTRLYTNGQSRINQYAIEENGTLSLTSSIETEYDFGKFDISSDNRFLYATSLNNVLCVFQINSDDGSLIKIQELTPNDFSDLGRNTIISPDKKHLYANNTMNGSDRFLTFNRDPSIGTLRYEGTTAYDNGSQVSTEHRIRFTSDGQYLLTYDPIGDRPLCFLRRDSENGELEVKETIYGEEDLGSNECTINLSSILK